MSAGRPIPNEELTEGGAVLITGATGFTGGQVARALQSRGYRVRALVRPTADAAGLAEAGIEIVHGDITDGSSVMRAADGVQTIYHIAAVFRTAGHSDDYYRSVNVGGTCHVLDAAARYGVDRVVHCSTIGVHGAVSDVPSHEGSPFNPGDIYQETKLEGELAVQEAIREGLPGVVVRPGSIYGPGDMRFLKLFRAVRSGRFMMFGSGDVTLHLAYIDDLVDGFILCGERPEALGETYILCGDEYTSLNEFVRLIADAVGVRPPRGHLPLWPLMAAAVVCERVCRPFGIEPPLHKRRVEFFIKPRAFSIAKARRELSYDPRVNASEGLRWTAEWYVRHGHLARPPGTRQTRTSEAA